MRAVVCVCVCVCVRVAVCGGRWRPSTSWLEQACTSGTMATPSCWRPAGLVHTHAHTYMHTHTHTRTNVAYARSVPGHRVTSSGLFPGARNL